VGLSEVLDFTEAAEKTIHTVSHVKNVSRTTVSNPNIRIFMGIKADNLRNKWEQVLV
jgi:hypothetical protein